MMGLINISIDASSVLDSTARRKRSQIQRVYKSNLNNLSEDCVRIIPQDDERLDYLPLAKQDLVQDVNNRIRKEGVQKEENLYKLSDEANKEELKNLFEYAKFSVTARDRYIKFTLINILFVCSFCLVVYILHIILSNPPT